MLAGPWLVIIAATLILLAYHYDTRRKMAFVHLIAAVVFGFVSMAMIGRVDDLAFSQTDVANVLIVKAAAVAMIEEGGKLVSISILGYTLFRRRLATPLDGLLIGQMVGLGMALNESMLYLQLQGQSLQLLGMEVVRLFAHSLMAGVVGFGVGSTRVRTLPGAQRWHCLLLCVGLTSAIHFTWNVIAYAQPAGLPGHLIPMMLMLTLMLLWKTFCNIAERHYGSDWPITIAPLRMA